MLAGFLFLHRFGSIRKVNQAYGMTETTLSVLISPADKVKSGSPGIIVPNMKCKVINSTLMFFF